MKRSAWIVLAAVLVLLPMAVWLSQNITVATERIELGPDAAARANPYLAMEYFLKQQDTSVAWLTSLTTLPQLTDELTTLIVLNTDVQWLERQSPQLLTWVAQGGHLIVSAEHEAVNTNQPSLLNRLGIKKHRAAELQQTDLATQATSSTQHSQPSDTHPALTRLYLENEWSPAYLSLDTRYHLTDADNRAHAWANSQHATHLLQLSHGHGLVTVLNDFQLWNNQSIRRYDHAWLLWYLSQETQVLLLNAPAQKGLLALLWQYYAWACLLLISLLVLGAWYAAPRFGPFSSVEHNVRRRLAEHLYASAAFNLRYNGQRSLLTVLQKDIQLRAQQRHPGFAQLAVAQQWQVLQQLSRQPITLIAQCMRPAPHKKLSAHAFTLHVQRLQQLRNAL